jgi:hypothetical protein
MELATEPPTGLFHSPKTPFGHVNKLDLLNKGPFKFEVQQHLTELRIPPVVSDNQALFAGGH